MRTIFIFIALTLISLSLYAKEIDFYFNIDRDFQIISSSHLEIDILRDSRDDANVETLLSRSVYVINKSINQINPNQLLSKSYIQKVLGTDYVSRKNNGPIFNIRKKKMIFSLDFEMISYLYDQGSPEENNLNQESLYIVESAMGLDQKYNAPELVLVSLQSKFNHLFKSSVTITKFIPTGNKITVINYAVTKYYKSTLNKVNNIPFVNGMKIMKDEIESSIENSRQILNKYSNLL